MKLDFAGEKVTLEEVLESREKRDFKQKDLLCRYHNTLINLKLNIAGEVKSSPAYVYFINEVSKILEEKLKDEDIRIIYKESDFQKTGDSIIFIVEEEKTKVKKICTRFEEENPWGRLLDIDVFDEEGSISRTDVGYDKRRCLLCEDNSFICRRLGRHTLKEISDKTHNLIIAFIEDTN